MDVAVIGAGMVGLSTAWFLQEAGAQVTVYDRDRVAAGASWGNAGWLTPALTAPLPEPAVLRYGLRAVLSPRSPVYLPLRADPTLARFLAGFVRHSTARAWRVAVVIDQQKTKAPTARTPTIERYISGQAQARLVVAKKFVKLA